MAKKKDLILTHLNEVPEKDTQLLKYLQTNTMLFKKSKVKEPEPIEVPHLERTPIPWHVGVELLDKIEA